MIGVICGALFGTLLTMMTLSSRQKVHRYSMLAANMEVIGSKIHGRCGKRNWRSDMLERPEGRPARLPVGGKGTNGRKGQGKVEEERGNTGQRAKVFVVIAENRETTSAAWRLKLYQGKTCLGNDRADWCLASTVCSTGLNPRC